MESHSEQREESFGSAGQQEDSSTRLHLRLRSETCSSTHKTTYEEVYRRSFKPNLSRQAQRYVNRAQIFNVNQGHCRVQAVH
jgi:hypothetical protein